MGLKAFEWRRHVRAPVTVQLQLHVQISCSVVQMAGVESKSQHTTSMNIPCALTPIDPLGESLHALRMSGVFYTRSEFSAPWGLELPPMKRYLMFHLLTSGQCLLEVGRGASYALQTGDFVLIPHGAGHRLMSKPGITCGKLFDLPREQVSERYEILRHGGGLAPATMICGAVQLDSPAAKQLIRLLPPVIHLEATRSAYGEAMSDTLRLMASEARSPRPGGEAITTRLADIMVIQAIRAWIENDPAARTGWLGALRDKQIGRAMTLVHRDPAQDWTVASLASTVGMSRSGFAARFAKLVGTPAMQYVLQWRMNSALTELTDNDIPVATVAARFGYQSEAAFSRAFKRVMGFTPGSVGRSRKLHD